MPIDINGKLPTDINGKLISIIIVFIILIFFLIASIFIAYIKNKGRKKSKEQKSIRGKNLDLKISKNIYGKLSLFFEETFERIYEIEESGNISEISQFKKESKQFIKDVMSQQLYKDFKYKSSNWENLDELLKKLEKDSVMTWKYKYKDKIEEVINGK